MSVFQALQDSECSKSVSFEKKFLYKSYIFLGTWWEPCNTTIFHHSSYFSDFRSCPYDRDVYPQHPEMTINLKEPERSLWDPIDTIKYDELIKTRTSRWERAHSEICLLDNRTYLRHHHQDHHHHYHHHHHHQDDRIIIIIIIV